MQIPTRAQEKLSGVKRKDAYKFRNHQAGCQGLVSAPRDGGHVVQTGAWHIHTRCRDYCQEVGIMENEDVELDVRVCDSNLDFVGKD